jgi:hypothetical protein
MDADFGLIGLDGDRHVDVGGVIPRQQDAVDRLHASPLTPKFMSLSTCLITYRSKPVFWGR